MKTLTHILLICLALSVSGYSESEVVSQPVVHLATAYTEYVDLSPPPPLGSDGFYHLPPSTWDKMYYCEFVITEATYPSDYNMFIIAHNMYILESGGTELVGNCLRLTYMLVNNVTDIEHVTIYFATTITNLGTDKYGNEFPDKKVNYKLANITSMDEIRKYKHWEDFWKGYRTIFEEGLYTIKFDHHLQQDWYPVLKGDYIFME